MSQSPFFDIEYWWSFRPLQGRHIGNSKRIIPACYWKNAMLYDKSPRTYASSRPTFTQRRQWANSRAFLLNIEGATDYYRLSKWKHIYIISLYKLFTLSNNIPVAGDSTIDPSGHSDYSYAHFYTLIVEYLVLRSPPLWYKSTLFRSIQKELYTVHRVNFKLLDTC